MKPVNEYWGDTRLILEDPPIDIVKDVVLIPFDDKVFLDRDPSWGVYHEDGSLVRPAAYIRQDKLVGQSPFISATGTSDTIESNGEEFIYGGPIIPHFGHWLLSSICRLWPLLQRGDHKRFKVIFHASHAPSEWFKNEYMRTIWGALGLTAHDFIIPAVPTRIEQLIVPHAAFVEQNAVHAIYSSLCRQLGDRIMLKEANPYRRGKKIYISKSRLSGGVTRIVNEAQIEEAARCLGFEVVHLESLILSEQIQIFRVADLVAGFAASAFHVSAFSRGRADIVILSQNNFVNSNFKLLDLAGGVLPPRAKYLDVSEEISEEGSGDGFMINYRVNNIEAIKGALAALS